MIVRTAVFLALTGVVGIAKGAAAQMPAAASIADRYLRKLRDSTKTPAISAAVMQRGRLVYVGATGFIDLEHRAPATGASVYNIGSVSKIVTAVAMMQLLEEHRVRLDDDIRQYVPSFPDKGAVVTLRHVLTHTSGIRHYRPTDFPGTPDVENIQPISSYLDGLPFFANDPLLFPPGSHYFYSSYAVNLLQGVIEKASRMSFEEYLKARVWGPAGMKTASFDIPERIVPHRTRSYRLTDGTLYNYYYNDLRYKFASGGMIASVQDLVAFGAAVNAGRLLKPETRTQMFAPQIPGVLQFRENGPPVPQRYEQGMLWTIRRDAARRRIAYHCGSVKASNACLVNFLEEDLVVAVATNSWECCGWSSADSLAAVFRNASRRK